MPENNHNWQDLARSIQKGRTILVLGPDAIPFYPVGVEAVDMPNPSFSDILRANITNRPGW